MTSPRRSASSIAAALVYLVGLVGGGFHHHVLKASPVANGAPRLVAFSDASSDCDSDDSHICTLCSAIHQAKTPPPAPVAVTSHTAAGQPVTFSICQHPVLFPVRTHARAPPLL